MFEIVITIETNKDDVSGIQFLMNEIRLLIKDMQDEGTFDEDAAFEIRLET